MSKFMNTSDKYGDYIQVTIEDYRELNPDGDFEEKLDGIYEDGEMIAELVEDVPDYAEIFEALMLRRELVDGGRYDYRPQSERWGDILAMRTAHMESKQERIAARKNCKRLLTVAEDLFQNGYRLKFGERRQAGIKHPVPEAALDWEVIPAGFIGTCEAYRLAYIIKK